MRHAAARTDDAAVSRGDALVRYHRAAGEETAVFADRIRTLDRVTAGDPVAALG